jgi:hypothetical protein
MKTRKTAVEYPDLREVQNTITTLTPRQPFKGKIISGGEFENHSLQQPVSNKKITEINTSVRHKKLKGLCGNCDFADTCIYSKPVTGIWHCNEYQ